MEDSVRQRIESVFCKYNINPTQFSGGDKAMQKRLSRQLKGGASVTCETLLSILNRYNNVSAEWLLRGKGEMLLNDSSLGDNIATNIEGGVSGGVIGNKVHSGNINGNGNNVGILPADCEKELMKSQCEVEYLKKEIKSLKEQLKQISVDKEKALLDKDKVMGMLEKALNK